VNRGGFVARDQTVGLGARHRRIALNIRDDEIEFGAAQGFDAAGLIDHLHRQLRGVDATLANLCKTAGDRVKSADIDRVRRCRRANVKCADCACGERARGFDEKIPAAKPRRIKLIFGLCHLNLPELSALQLKRRHCWRSGVLALRAAGKRPASATC